MQVAIVNLTGGGLSGGYRKYLQKLMPLLQNDPRISDLSIFIPPQALKVSELLSELDTSRIYVWPEMDQVRRYSWLKAHLHQSVPDVVFIPTARWLSISQIPTVVMVRNMEPLVVPFGGNSLLESLKNLARAYTARKACQCSSRVVAVSQYVQDFLVRAWHINPQKIGVTYHGVESPPAPDELVLPDALKGKDLGPFVFTAGSIRPARGLEDLIKALAVLRKRNLPHTLVIGGEPDPRSYSYKKRMEHLADDCGVAAQIIWAGQLSSLEMSWCYSHCSAFVMTSRVEACSNVVLEAMSHGALCISGDNPPMPEFFQDAGRFYVSGNADSLAEALMEQLNRPESEQIYFRRLARQRALDFSWEETAERTIRELEKACR